MVCEIKTKKIGFVVDGFNGQQEIVIKKLTGYLEQFKGFSGASILGNGQVAMILDLAYFVD